MPKIDLKKNKMEVSKDDPKLEKRDKLFYDEIMTNFNNHSNNHSNHINANNNEEVEVRGENRNTFKKKVSLIKEITAEVFSNSTMHGLSRIIKAKSWIIKLIWAVFLITSIFCFVSYSIESLYDFLDFKVTTEIRTIYETPTIFPTVTFCNSKLILVYLLKSTNLVRKTLIIIKRLFSGPSGVSFYTIHKIKII